MRSFGIFKLTVENALKGFNSWSLNLPACVESDHICWKCASSDEYEQMLLVLKPQCFFVYESMISGRRIAILKLKVGFESESGFFRFVELSDQKPDGSQVSGLDHLQVYHRKLIAEQLAEELETKGGLKFVKVFRPHHTTYEADLSSRLTIHLADEPLIDKICLEARK